MVTPRSWWATEPSSPVSSHGPGHIRSGQCSSLISYVGWREQRVYPVISLLVGIGETPVPQRSDAGRGLIYRGGRKASLYLMCMDPICAGSHTVGAAPCSGVNVSVIVYCTAPGRVCPPHVLSFIVR